VCRTGRGIFVNSKARCEESRHEVGVVLVGDSGHDDASRIDAREQTEVGRTGSDRAFVFDDHHVVVDIPAHPERRDTQRLDEPILPLKRGDNVLRFAVSEDFGGWAITAQLPDSAGIEVLDR